ncbi:DUF998 domain-containing protein [Aeromicrobium sp. CF4.19]|uniref:DUF998 domain-containing protein n=1 Tax=Aeromicrobium sp. CF4.19 TaxID=3373082 RepID=UPI003EE488A0
MNDTLVTLTLSCGVLAPPLFVITFLLDGTTRAGYEPMHHTVSALALGPRRWLQTVSFLLAGLAVTVASIGVRAASGSLVLGLAIAVFGVALVVSGLFRMDPMRGYPPGATKDTPEVVSMQHRVHDWAGAVVFTALPAAAAVAVLVIDDAAWAVASGVTAVAFTILLLAFGAAWEADGPRTGLLQKLAIVVGWSWLALLCWHLLP